MLKLNAFCVAVALASAPSNAACWSTQDASAARVRDFQTMLMVSALRCHAAHFEIAPEYNAFVTAATTTINAANDRIKSHFRGEAGPVEGQRAYDRFTTSLANSYGAGSTTAEDCSRAAAVAHAAAAAGSPEALFRLADETLFGSPVEACGAPIMAEAATRPVPVVMAAPPPIALALAAPVTTVPAQATPAVALAAAAPPQAAPLPSAPVELASATANNVLPLATAR